MPLFTTTYAPQNSQQIIGQELAVTQLKNFIQNYKQQKNKAALLHGPIGCGKTSSVYAVANELGYDILELNSSDYRDQSSISSFLDSALGQQSLFFTPKLILIDEVDNLSGMQDRGCISALMKGIERSSFPIICTANDLAEDKLKPLRKSSLIIEFQKIDQKTMVTVLKKIAESERIIADEKALSALARQVDGDIRAALIDLQLSGVTKTLNYQEVLKLSDRKRTQSILQALQVIFKSSSAETALPALDDIDVEIDHVFFWLDENLPKEYLSVTALAKAYEHLSRADVFRGRIRRQQHWRFLVYISNLLSAGISSAKDEKNTSSVRYQQTMRLLKMWQAKMKVAKKKEIAEKIADKMHLSKKRAFQEVDFLKPLLYRQDVAAELELNEEEVSWVRK
ncbi:replication factor C large subunit [Candidatus Woesearchaeota archaeon]|nr:replication factor C large subunit [Candidatus Woesearchaeota archaeon]